MIGNKVLANGEEVTLLLVGKAAVQAYTDTPDVYDRYTYDKLDGIPLTDEVLSRLPLWQSDDWGWYVEKSPGKRLRLLKRQEEYYPVVEEDPEMSHGDIQCIGLKYIKYLHQLQNITYWCA